MKAPSQHNPPSRTGGCLCGAFRYTLLVAPDNIGNCHCLDCRRAAAAPYVTWGVVPTTACRIERGAVRVVTHAGRLRSFAACCGTPVFFQDPAEPQTLDVAIASLDDPSAYPPDKNIWLEDQLPGVALDPTLPAYPRSSRPTASGG